MYVNPFLAGVIFTIFSEIALVIVAAIVSNNKNKK